MTGAESFVGGFCNRGCNLGASFESKVVSFCVGTKTIDEVLALAEATHHQKNASDSDVHLLPTILQRVGQAEVESSFEKGS